jgi:hypothetical protein
MPTYVGDEVVAIMRSEILDELTCPICSDELDGIVLPEDDPSWAGELGMPAHPNCRFALIPLTEGTPAVLNYMKTIEVPQVIRHMNQLMTPEFFNDMRIPVRGLRRLHAQPIKVGDIRDAMGPDDVLQDILGIGPVENRIQGYFPRYERKEAHAISN